MRFVPSRLSSWARRDVRAGQLYIHPASVDSQADGLAQAEREDIEERLATGSFMGCSIVLEAPDDILHQSDIVNRTPLFYESDMAYISDEIEPIAYRSLDPTAMRQYFLAGYVTGSRTLSIEQRRSQAGELLIFGSGGVRARNCFEYSYPAAARDVGQKAAPEEADAFGTLLDAAIYSAIESRELGRQIIVPLSGGHDSRLLISRLAALGVENVLCFSYGRPGNEQSRISRQVAEALGYRWHFVEYTEEKWQALHDAGIIEAYARFAFRGSSIPHLQDFLAVHELLQSGLIASDDLCMPGHTLDFVSGGHVGQSDFDCHDADSAVKLVLRRHFSGLPDDGADEPELVERIHELFEVFDGPASQFQEWFNWRERQTKFIVNSCANYEFHGLQVALPFWDIDVVRYWLSVPPAVKAGRRFYFEMEPYLLDRRLREIPFAGEVKANRSLSKRVQLALRKHIPTWLASRLVSVARLRRQQNEGVNLAFAGLGEDIRSALPHLAAHPIAEWAPIRDILCRRPYQLNGHRMAALYTLNLLLGEQLDGDEST